MQHNVKYYASEIDKYAIKVTQANFPNTIQLGDVRNIQPHDWQQSTDILVGGSPCQSFSFAGKQLNFDDDRGKLFFEFVRLRDELKPKYFLLENVRMKKEYQKIMEKYLGVSAQTINSADVSAQNRVRLYFFGKLMPSGEYEMIPIPKPTPLNLKMQDILEEDGIAHDLMTNKEGKAHCLTATYNGAVWWNSIQRKQRTMVGCIEVGHAEEYAHYKHEQAKRVYHQEGKSPTLLTMQGGNREPKVATYSTKGGRIVNVDDMTWRKLTPLECERLQGLPDNYTNHVSKTQRYKMLGNGFNIPTISHIIKDLPLHEFKYIVSCFDGYSGFQQAFNQELNRRNNNAS